MDFSLQGVLKFLQDSPALALGGVATLLASLWLIVVKTMYSKLGEWLQSLLVAVLEPLDKAFRTQMARRFSLRAYCRLLLANDQFRYLFVPGADDSRLDVDRAFITLRLENASTTGQQWFTHQTLLELGKRVRVVGDPGSGKSSLVKRMLRDACQVGLVNAKNAKLPLLLELRQLKLPAGVEETAALGKWLFDELKQQITQHSTLHKPAECFDAYFAGPGLLVLLDGLDEVASTYYPFIREALQGLSQKLAANPNNQVVLTMRSQFHEQVKNDFRDDGSQAVLVQPFAPADIYQFLQRWLFLGQDEQTARDTRIRIYRELTERVSLREMCRNPLVLSMYVAKDYGRAADFPPSSRTGFYAKVVDELLIRRSFRQGTAVKAGVADSLRDQREQILGTLALQHMLDPEQGANQLSWRAAIELVRRVMQCDEAQAVAHFDEMAKDTGLIVPVQQRESFRFMHLTFCEFFAALGACNWVSDGWLDLLAKHAAWQGFGGESGKNRLIEVLPFAFGLMKPMERVVRLNTLLPIANASLLARTFLECKLYNHAGWPRFIEGWKATLLATPEPAWDEAWLAEVHLFSVVVTHAKQHQPFMGGVQVVPDLAAFFSTMVKSHREGLGKLLHAYAKLDAEALFSLAELNQIDLVTDFPEVVLRNCDQPMFLEAILHKALADPARGAAWAALFAEAGLRAGVVAEQLAQMPMEKIWQALADATPQAARWHNNRFMPDCLYSQCLSIACAQGTASDGRLTLLQVFRTVPAPGGYRLLTNGAWLPLVVGYASLVAGLALWAGWLARFSFTDMLLMCSLSAFFALIGCWLKENRLLYLFQVTCCQVRGRWVAKNPFWREPIWVELLTTRRLVCWRASNYQQVFLSGVIALCGVAVLGDLGALATMGEGATGVVAQGLIWLGLVAVFGLVNLLVLGHLLIHALGLPLLRSMVLGVLLCFVVFCIFVLFRLPLLVSLLAVGLALGYIWVIIRLEARLAALGRALGQITQRELRFGLDATVPADTYWGKNMANASAAVQEARRALGINSD